MAESVRWTDPGSGFGSVQLGLSVSHSKPTVNERLGVALQIANRNNEMLLARIEMLESLVGAIIRHFDLKLEDVPEEKVQ